MKALDTSEPTIGMAQTIVNQGYQAVGVYLRPDRCSAAMVAELRHAGLKNWSMYEKGFPTHDEYFTTARGSVDGHAAAAFAKQVIAQPAGTDIYACVDYDPDHNNAQGPTISGRISDYMRAFASAVDQAGYVSSVYGSGRTCRILVANGLARRGWLCVSSSFAEHAEFLPHAAIVQKRCHKQQLGSRRDSGSRRRLVASFPKTGGRVPAPRRAVQGSSDLPAPSSRVAAVA